MSLPEEWLHEEALGISGWDFTHLQGRCEETPLPFDYRAEVLSRLTDAAQLLDLGTGGGEFLLSLHHAPSQTCVTEAWLPNVALCRERLSPLGVRVEAVAEGDCRLPFSDGAFDLVISRHEAFDPAEVARVLRPGGAFVTQQVGGRNDRALSELLIPGFEPPFPQVELAPLRAGLESAGLTVVRAEESFTPIRFLDVGALVWFARAIPWEFPGFTVAGSMPQLLAAQRLVETTGAVEGLRHRLLLVAQKPV